MLPEKKLHGIITAHPNYLYEPSILENTYLFFDKVVCLYLNDAIQTQLHGLHGDVKLGHLMRELRELDIICDPIDLVPNINDLSAFNQEECERTIGKLMCRDTGNFSAKEIVIASYLQNLLAKESWDKKKEEISRLAELEGGLPADFPAVEAMYSSLWNYLHSSNRVLLAVTSFVFKLSGIEAWAAQRFDNAEIVGDVCNEYAVNEIVLQNVPIPKGVDLRKMKELKKQQTIRDSLRAYREIVSILNSRNYSKSDIEDYVRDAQRNLEQELRGLGVKRAYGLIRILVTQTAGFAEDVIKFRLESLSERFFKVAESVSKLYVVEEKISTHPLYFINEMKSLK